MCNDFIIDKGEFSIAVNKISQISLALSESIDQYVRILTDLQYDGIKDALICSELADIALEVRKYQKNIMEVNEQLVPEIMNPGIDEITANDNFGFPLEY